MLNQYHHIFYLNCLFEFWLLIKQEFLAADLIDYLKINLGLIAGPDKESLAVFLQNLQNLKPRK